MTRIVNASSHRVQGRLAPSPTGAQHVGNARTYLIAWLSARSQGGRIALRIEDIDSPRVKPHAVQGIFEDLEWLGLDWDGTPIVQTERMPLYERAFAELQARNLVYPCTCTRKDVEAAASAPHGDGEEPAYPGTCAHRTPADARHLTKPFAWRYRVQESPITFDDRFAGRTTIDLTRVGGDFVVWKSSGTPAYQLAVVVDDGQALDPTQPDEVITEVIRGDDLLSSTPRQLLIYKALGMAPPEFAHVPLVVGPDGRRLAKRHGDTRLSALRDAGISAEQLIGLLAWSCGWIDRPTPIAARELLPHFRWDTIPHTPFVLSPEVLSVLGKAPLPA